MRPVSGQSHGGEARESAAVSSYGWVIVFVSFILLVGSFGTQLSFGVFLKPLSTELGWTRAAASGAMSLAMGISGVIGVGMGRLTDRFDIRIPIGIAAVLGTVCYMLLARMHSLWQLYLYFGLGGGICIGSTYTPVSAMVTKWFREKRALALGMAAMGIGVGQMVLSPLAAYLIESFGWRTTYMVLGVIIFVCALPALFLLGRKAPERPVEGQAPSLDKGMTTRQAAATAPFWMMMITGIAIAAGFYTMAAHIVPAATDVGITPTAAALILALSSAAGIPGGVIGTWWLTKTLGHKWTLLLVCAIQAVALFLFILTTSLWAFNLVAIIFGFCFAVSTPVRQAMAPPLFGLRSIGAVLGLAYLAWSVGALAGPYIAGLIYDRTGNYDFAFVLTGVLLLIASASIYLWGDHKRR
ncbi:MAG: MFS transporter [Thermoleophilia bacterium]|jgi:MFS family permease